MPDFPDHFSSVASSYARFRPNYPAALFDWVVRHAPARDIAWDCACGSGQATLALAERFHHIVATDASAEQLQRAPTHPHIEWRVATAEQSGIAAHSVDAIVVAQALHWFDLPRFWAEVQRVARSRALVAAWTYGLVSTDDTAITAALRDLHDNAVGAYWPIERGHVERRYEGIMFPFDRLDTPGFEMTATWTLAELAGYLRTWSAVRRHVAATGRDPIDAFTAGIAPAWGDGTRTVRWPLTVLAGTTP